MKTREEILQMVENEDVEFIRLQFTDMFGTLKNVAVTATQLQYMKDNRYLIDGSCMYGELRNGEEDMYLCPDLDTFVILPWRPQQGKVARLLCDVCRADGTPLAVSPREILKKTMEKVEKEGYTFQIDPECEFFLFHEDENGVPTTVTHEKAGYMDISPLDLGENARRDMVMTLEDMGFEIESSHHEKAPGQHEIDFRYAGAMETADRIVTFKTAVRSIAKRFGLYATFMPKPNMSGDGSGLHVGVSISSRRGAEAMAQAKQFAAGVLKNLSDMMIFTNPTVNSYKRLAAERSTVFQPEFPAAVWEKGSEKAVHVKEDRNGRISVEVQFPDPSANPYLALTAILAAGLEGIEKALVLDEEAGDEDAPRFPETLGILLQKLDQNEFAHRVFGEKFCRMYGEGKKEEWERFCAYVTDWETAEYLYRC